MRIKYNRVSTVQQSGERFSIDQDKYDIILLDKVSGSVSFKERPKAKELVLLIERGQVSEIIVEEFSRLGRNMADVINVLQWLEEFNINVIVKNLGLQSRPQGKKNPIWNMLSAILSSIYEMEVENIKERTAMGRMVYIQKGGLLGRPEGSTESQKDFLNKPKTKEIIKWLNRGRTIREISSYTKASNKTVIKAKSIAIKYGLLEEPKNL